MNNTNSIALPTFLEEEIEKKLQRSKELEKELDALDARGFESEISSIREKLKNLDKISEADKEIANLKEEIEKRDTEIKKKTQRLKELEKEFNALDNKEFKFEAKSIKSKLKDIKKVDEVEKEILELKGKIEKAKKLKKERIGYRKAAVSGAFYEAETSRLQKQLKECFSGVTREEKENVLGAVVPHAGYMYSGGVAANAYAKLPRADTFVILGPNHQGIGSLVAVSKDIWITPLGEVEVDKAFVDALPKRIIEVDETAHKYEHSIEIQLPFLQYLFDKNFRFVPICMGLSDEDTAREIGEDLARTISEVKKKVVMIASSDINYYEPEEITREKSEYVIEAITELDIGKFYNRIYERNSTACGVGPIAAMMHAAKKLGATQGELVKYATSGDITGDMSSVVGYGGIIIF